MNYTSLLYLIYKSKRGVCLSVWTKIGQCLEDSSSHCLFCVELVCNRWQNKIGEVITRAQNQHPWHIFSMRIERIIKSWCLSVCVFVTDIRPLDLLAARSNSSLICGPRWLCERRIRVAPGIWARGQKKQRNISHTRTHVRMHAQFLHPMLSLCTRTGTHPQILASRRISSRDQDLGISISSSSSLLQLRGFLTRSLRNKLL
jgi:hypothetical protein